jgi:hypothetical protein
MGRLAIRFSILTEIHSPARAGDPVSSFQAAAPTSWWWTQSRETGLRRLNSLLTGKSRRKSKDNGMILPLADPPCPPTGPSPPPQNEVARPLACHAPMPGSLLPEVANKYVCADIAGCGKARPLPAFVRPSESTRADAPEAAAARLRRSTRLCNVEIGVRDNRYGLDGRMQASNRPWPATILWRAILKYQDFANSRSAKSTKLQFVESDYTRAVAKGSSGSRHG